MKIESLLVVADFSKANGSVLTVRPAAAPAKEREKRTSTTVCASQSV